MSGKLVLIGCGPGDPDLLTLRAVERIREADLLLYDRLINKEILNHAGSDAKVDYVGKRCTDGGRQQAQINEQIKRGLEKGQTVVRLKSGDPMVFGRAVEEIAMATETGSELEIVPGVTAVLAAAASEALAITERAEIQSFIITTARTASDAHMPDWATMAVPGSCIAFYMGVAQAWRIQSSLMTVGVPGTAPATWVERAGQSTSRAINTRVDRISLTAMEQIVENPAVLIVRYPLSLAAHQAMGYSSKGAIGQ